MSALESVSKKEMKNPPHFVWGGLRIIDSLTYTITSKDGYRLH